MNRLLRISVVARHEGRVSPGDLRGIDHHLAIDGMEGLNDLRPGKRLLNLFAKRFRAALLWRKDVRNVNQDLAGKVLFAGHAEGCEGVPSVRAVENQLAESGCVLKAPGLRALTEPLRPGHCLWIIGFARAHHHIVAECNELRCDRISNHACSHDSNLHLMSSSTLVLSPHAVMVRPCACRCNQSRMAPAK